MTNGRISLTGITAELEGCQSPIELLAPGTPPPIPGSRLPAAEGTAAPGTRTPLLPSPPPPPFHQSSPPDVDADDMSPVGRVLGFGNPRLLFQFML